MMPQSRYPLVLTRSRISCPVIQPLPRLGRLDCFLSKAAAQTQVRLRTVGYNYRFKLFSKGMTETVGVSPLCIQGNQGSRQRAEARRRVNGSGYQNDPL
jgi:hypothetical protein